MSNFSISNAHCLRYFLKIWSNVENYQIKKMDGNARTFYVTDNVKYFKVAARRYPDGVNAPYSEPSDRGPWPYDLSAHPIFPPLKWVDPSHPKHIHSRSAKESIQFVIFLHHAWVAAAVAKNEAIRSMGDHCMQLHRLSFVASATNACSSTV